MYVTVQSSSVQSSPVQLYHQSTPPRPHVAGIAGTATEGCPSLVLGGGYEDDVDDGDSFTYTGSGGRDLSGNKRTAPQSSGRAVLPLLSYLSCPVLSCL